MGTGQFAGSTNYYDRGEWLRLNVTYSGAALPESAVPEPSSWALPAIGAACFAALRAWTRGSNAGERQGRKVMLVVQTWEPGVTRKHERCSARFPGRA